MFEILFLAVVGLAFALVCFLALDVRYDVLSRLHPLRPKRRRLAQLRRQHPAATVSRLSRGRYVIDANPVAVDKLERDLGIAALFEPLGGLSAIVAQERVLEGPHGRGKVPSDPLPALDACNCLRCARLRREAAGREYVDAGGRWVQPGDPEWHTSPTPPAELRSIYDSAALTA